jgi:hypothetical protein
MGKNFPFKWFLKLLFFFCFFSVTLFSATDVDYSIHQEYMSVRALGMGNAFGAFSDDHHTLFYNPAGLAHLKRGHINMSIRVGATIGNESYLDLIDDIDTAASSGTDEEQVTNLTNTIQKRYGTNYFARLSPLGFMWARPNWGIAFLPLDLTSKLAIHGPYPQLDVLVNQDATLAFGLAKKINEEWSVGATLKSIYRIHYSNSFFAMELAISDDTYRIEDAEEGVALDLNTSVMYTPQFDSIWLRPSFSLVLRNAADIGFLYNPNVLSDNENKPPDLQRRIDLASKWELPQLWLFYPRFSFDVRDLTHDNVNTKKSLHAGFEMGWYVGKYLNGAYRAGINQGYWTAGATFKLLWFQLDLVSYGEEIGTKDAEEENRIYMVQMSLDF